MSALPQRGTTYGRLRLPILRRIGVCVALFGQACLGLSGCSGDESVNSSTEDAPTPVDAADSSGVSGDIDADTNPGSQCAGRADGSSCDDGRSCTSGDVCDAGVCVSGSMKCACEPGHQPCAAAQNLCLGPARCVPLTSADARHALWTCVQRPEERQVCATGADTTCMVAACNPETGTCALHAIERTQKICDGTPCRRERLAASEPAAKASPCDDGLPCSANDHCAKGACVAESNACECLHDADCVDDGDLCNGLPRCDKTGTTWTCKVDPATVSDCPPGAPLACSTNACDPKSGACVALSLPKGATCSDGVACTHDDTCDGLGQCDAGTSTCCAADADCTSLDDGDLCNGTLFCHPQTGACTPNPGSKVVCATAGDGACKTTACASKTGKCAVNHAAKGAACEDGEVCTSGDACDGKGGCVTGSWSCCKNDNDCVAQDDGNLCNGTLSCNVTTGGCDLNLLTVVTCPSVDDTECLANQCAPKSGLCGLAPANFGKPCSDGHVCTAGDVCANGSCLPGTDVCPCKVDADCAKLEDGDACNGTLYCHATGGPGGGSICKVNPLSVVTCPSSGDTACLKNTCDAVSGKCAALPLPSSVTCDADGTSCTQGDACSGGGACVAGAAVCECLSDKDCLVKEDGNVCNGVLYCDKSGVKPACKVNPASVKTCPSGADTACLKNRCQPSSGGCSFVAAAAGAPCTDGDPCTGPDACVEGKCGAGPSLCSCKTHADCHGLDDGNKCNGVFQCQPGAQGTTSCVFASSTTVACPDDGTACADLVCQPATGVCKVTPVPKGVVCVDGNACTKADACDGQGGCNGAPVICGDANPCTDDACVGTKGCIFAMNTAACSDGDSCSIGDVCTKGACVATGKLGCDDSNPCTADGCAKLTGCTHAPFVGVCSDGNACTTKEVCKAGQCASGPALTCDDGNVCTTDSCNTTTGCVVIPVTLPCDDTNPCTVGDACAKGVCKAGKAKDCDDGVTCTLDSCSASLGCVHTVSKGDCDDGDPCTLGSTCVGATCSGGKPRLGKWQVGTLTNLGPGAAMLAGHKVALTGGGKVPLTGGGTLVVVGATGLVESQMAIPTSAYGCGGIIPVGLNAVLLACSEGAFRVDLQQAKIVAKTLFSDEIVRHIYDAAQQADGAVVAVGLRDLNNARLGTVVALDMQAKVLWTKAFGSLGGDALYGVAAFQKGTVVVGQTGQGTSSSPNAADKVPAWVLRLSDTGAVIWQRKEVPASFGAAFTAVAVHGNKIVAAGPFVTGSRVVAYDENGQELWKIGETELKGYLARGHGTADGVVFLGSLDAVDSQILRLGWSGAIFGLATFKHSLVTGVTWDDGLPVVHSKNGKLARTDLFGHTSCVTSGACAGEKTCNDQDPCTADSCTAANGCGHLAHLDGTFCAVGKTCKSGKCQ